MIPFDAAHEAVHYPPDRRFRVWMKPSFVRGVAVLILLPLLFAWRQAAIFGLPYIPPVPLFNEASPTRPHGCPLWIGYANFCNFFFVMKLVRCCTSIRIAPPRPT